MKSSEIRNEFITFFKDKGLKHMPSSSLIPDDPSLLLTSAGMVQFKQYFLGKKHLDAVGAVTCQKCVRTTDIDDIGLDGRHLSFFEMLGNFSFGGYNKRQACEYAYEFITKHLNLPLERLYFSIYLTDDDAYEIWRDLGIEEDHIVRLGDEDNFWAAGPTGPCGPCSEIYYDQGVEKFPEAADAEVGDDS
ncbi:MAG: alanine--tRNA ligase-related protein, partial [Coriobacteriia bacterium]|nr:alanine--tRNA ligase-related protein [Coriobacteriia bacterium]